MRDLAALRSSARSNAVESRVTSRTVAAGNRSVAESYARAGKAAEDSARRQTQAAKDVRRSLADLKREMAAVAGSGGGMRAGLGALGIAGGGALIAGGIRAYDAKQSLERSFRSQYGQAQAASTAGQVRNFSDTYGIAIKDVSLSLRQLSQFFDPAMLMRTMKAYTASGYMTGASPEGMAAAMVQYTQIANSGKVQGDELKIMEEHGFAVRRILREAGLGSRINSQTNPITFEELNNAILKFGETTEALQYMKEVSESGSVALTQMENTISQDLMPALGKEFTPVVKNLAREMPKLAGAATKVIENWEWVAGSTVVVWGGLKAGSIALTIQSFRAAKALAMVANTGNAAAASQGGGLLGGIFKKKPPKTAGTSVFKDTLGAGSLSTALPSWGGAAQASTGAMAGGVFVAGALALAGIVEGVGRLAGMSYDDTLFGQIENGLAGRGFKSGSQLRQEIDQEAERTFKPVREAEMRKAAYEKYRAGRRMSRTEYFMATGDDQIFATEQRRAEMQAQRQRSEAERLDSQERNRQRNWDAQGRRGGTSPRRASIDRANAEANARLNYGAGF